MSNKVNYTNFNAFVMKCIHRKIQECLTVANEYRGRICDEYLHRVVVATKEGDIPSSKDFSSIVIIFDDSYFRDSFEKKMGNKLRVLEVSCGVKKYHLVEDNEVIAFIIATYPENEIRRRDFDVDELTAKFVNGKYEFSNEDLRKRSEMGRYILNTSTIKRVVSNGSQNIRELNKWNEIAKSGITIEFNEEELPKNFKLNDLIDRWNKYAFTPEKYTAWKNYIRAKAEWEKFMA